MAEQILLQGKILGTEEFLSAAAAESRPARSAGEDLLAGRSQWITLMSEVLPRALLAELGLPAEVEHVRDMKDISALGVFGTPALLINDEVKAVGNMPSREALKKWLQEAATSPS